MPDFLAFLSVVLITTFTPGPNNIMSMGNAARYGFKDSIRFNYGVFAGFIIIMGLCSVFASALTAMLPGIKPYMQISGAMYILWLAWKTYKSSSDQIEEKTSANTFMSVFFCNSSILK